ncbi:MAG: universal stress protein [Anaerolineae bacterium]|nr:universal stress protein [Anaerolineae bacterium]
MFKEIIVAIDGSTHSHKALDYAKELAEQYGATLRLVHAFPHTSDFLGYDEYESLIARRENAGQLILDEARQRLGEIPFPVEEELLEGPSAKAILSVAETRHADLIIMGTHGRGSLQGFLLGSVSQKVIHHAHCPVMVVR